MLNLGDSFERSLKKFVADGNKVEGAPRAATGQCTIKWDGPGNILRFEAEVDLHQVALEFNKGGGQIAFHEGSRGCGKFIVEGGSEIKFGARTRCNKPAWFQALEATTISIGRSCLFADIRVRTSDVHSILSLDDGRRLNLARNVHIGNRVWIAEKAHVYKGVTIGRDTVIGAHAVVTRDIPANCVAAGNPAVVVREGVTWVRSLTPPEGDIEFASTRR